MWLKKQNKKKWLRNIQRAIDLTSNCFQMIETRGNALRKVDKTCLQRVDDHVHRQDQDKVKREQVNVNLKAKNEHDLITLGFSLKC